MKMVSVDSTAVLKIGHDGYNLFVQYVGGNWYKYRNVPETVFEQLCNANSLGHSVGRLINKEIKPKYKECETLLFSPAD